MNTLLVLVFGLVFALFGYGMYLEGERLGALGCLLGVAGAGGVLLDQWAPNALVGVSSPLVMLLAGIIAVIGLLRVRSDPA